MFIQNTEDLHLRLIGVVNKRLRRPSALDLLK